MKANGLGTTDLVALAVDCCNCRWSSSNTTNGWINGHSRTGGPAEELDGIGAEAEDAVTGGVLASVVLSSEP